MERYVNIMLDEGFKTVFGVKQVAIDFINAALLGERQVKDLTYLDKEIQPEVVEQRTVIFDLLCEDVDGSKFILEMQNCPQRYFFNRGFYYLCRMVSRQEQIYLSFDLFNLTKEECKTPLENTVYILKNMNLFDMSPFKEKEDAFRRLLDVANLNAMSDHERAVYEENLKIYRDWHATTEYAVEKAKEKGIKIGKAEGIELGEAKKQRFIAAKMKKQGVAIETIAEFTELSVKEIEEL